MRTRSRILLAASVVLAVLFGVWYVGSPPVPQPEVAPRDGSRGITADLPAPAEDEPVEERMVVEADAAPGAEAELASLLVRVIWQDTGEPAADVGLHLEDDSWPSVGEMRSTGGDGEVFFEGLEPGSYEVNADRRPVGRTIGGEIELFAGEQGILDLEVVRGLNVRGIVVNRDGVGVAGAEVLVAWGGVLPQWTYPATRTGSDGTFFLRGLGSMNLVGARAKGYGTSDFAMMGNSKRSADPEVPLRLVLPGSTMSLTGTVYDPLGKPVSGAWVEVGEMISGRILPDGSSGFGPPAVIRLTDSEGQFAVDSLPAGRHPVQVYLKGFTAWSRDVACPPFETIHVNVELQYGGVLVGQVRDQEGRPFSGVSVKIRGLPMLQRSSGGGYSDEEGRFRMEDVPLGEQEVHALGGTGDAVATLQFVAGQETRWDLTLDRGLQIRGILENHLGEPLSGWWISTMDGAATTDAAGRFVMTNREDRVYRLRLQEAFGYRPTITVVELRPGPEERRITVPEEAMPSATIVGRILTPEGRPAGGVDLYLEQYDWPISEVPDTDSDGRFEIGPLPPGTYELSGWRSDYASAEYGEVVVGPHDVKQLGDVRLRHGARLEVVFPSPGAKQLEGLQVRVLDGEGDSIERGILQENKVGFRPIPPGSWTLSISGPNISDQKLPIELRAQETLSLEVDLR